MLILSDKDIDKNESGNSMYLRYFIKKFVKNNANKNVLYVHTPFCLTKCRYCNYVSTSKFSQDDFNVFYNNILPHHLDIFSDIVFDEVYFGGGTDYIRKYR